MCPSWASMTQFTRFLIDVVKDLMVLSLMPFHIWNSIKSITNLNNWCERWDSCKIFVPIISHPFSLHSNSCNIHFSIFWLWSYTNLLFLSHNKNNCRSRKLVSIPLKWCITTYMLGIIYVNYSHLKKAK